MVKVVFLCCLLLLMRVTGLATSIALQTETSLSLSIEQEVEEAIERGQRWFKRQGITSIKGIDGEAFEALMFSSQPIVVVSPETVAGCMATVDAVDARAQSRYNAITAALNKGTLETLQSLPSELYVYVQRVLMPRCVNATLQQEGPPQWRTQLALYLVTSQRMDAMGGFWQEGSREESFWAVLLLRLLIHRQPALLPSGEVIEGLGE